MERFERHNQRLRAIPKPGRNADRTELGWRVHESKLHVLPKPRERDQQKEVKLTLADPVVQDSEPREARRRHDGGGLSGDAAECLFVVGGLLRIPTMLAVVAEALDERLYVLPRHSGRNGAGPAEE